MDVADKITYLRTKILQVNEIEFAEKCGVDRRTVYSWEHGVSKPNLQNMVAIAVASNTTLDYLLFDDKEFELYISDVNEGVYEILKSLVKEYRNLKKDGDK